MRIFLFLLVSSFVSANDHLERIYHVLPSLKESTLQAVLGGLTNANFKANLEDKTYFIRCNGKNSPLLDASLEREWICANFASHANLSPRPIEYYQETGVMVFEYI